MVFRERALESFLLDKRVGNHCTRLLENCWLYYFYYMFSPKDLNKYIKSCWNYIIIEQKKRPVEILLLIKIQYLLNIHGTYIYIYISIHIFANPTAIQYVGRHLLPIYGEKLAFLCINIVWLFFCIDLDYLAFLNNNIIFREKNVLELVDYSLRIWSSARAFR